MINNTEFNKAIAAAKKNNIHGWVLSFLRANGNNPTLADKLENEGHYHYGPIDYPIERIKNILGPDATYKFREDPSVLKDRTTAMANDIKAGWQPPPLIATNLWEDYFELADGGHRYRALEILGIKSYPTIFYFRSKESLDSFVRSI